MVCTYFQIGACSYGAGCRYDHVMLNNASQQVAPQPLSTHHIRPVVSANVLPFARGIPPRQINTAAPPVASHMMRLSKSGTVSAPPPTPAVDLAIQGLPPKLKVDDWVRAAEFVPGQKWQALSGPLSYSDAVQTGIPPSPDAVEQSNHVLNPTDESTSLCPYAVHGNCPFGGECAYVHGNICEFCGKATLVPSDELQNKKHTEECIKEHERSMEAAFAAQLSEGKTCGICHEVVWEKQSVAGRRFGILSDCSHIFCLACIRQWRSVEQYDNDVIRSCPECRIKSDFVIPSKFWVEGKDEKIRLIDNYKLALSKKPCMHFQQGNGKCPFNNSCFYEHAYPDGRKASPQQLRKFKNADGEVLVDRDPSLWDFLSAENERRSELANFLFSSANDEELFHLDSLQLHEPTTEDAAAAAID